MILIRNPARRVLAWTSTWCTILLLAAVPRLALAVGSPPWIIEQKPPPASPDTVALACRDAAIPAEQEAGLPPGLLLAIGQQESGRRDALSGEFLPWPYATNASGASRFFQTRVEAVSFVAQLLRAGIQSIDVGCFQVNLRQHPDAFVSLEEGFDPSANAHYAAHFLAVLHAQTGSWNEAIGRYHSATSAFAEPYKAAVLSRWNRPQGGSDTSAAGHQPRPELVAGVIVQRPSSFGHQIGALPSMVGLPHVITPTGNLTRVVSGRL